MNDKDKLASLVIEDSKLSEVEEVEEVQVKEVEVEEGKSSEENQ